MSTIQRKIAYVFLFSTAMGFMESAIVIYLRELFYPHGFSFPLSPIPHKLAVVEILREAATVIMLICVGYFAGKNKLQRFAFFSLAFAVWDLCYYLFLYVFLGWPESPFTWDILFLIPLPWVGPVWAPCLLSLLMLIGAIMAILKTNSREKYTFKKWEWFALIGGAIVCITSFMLDFLRAVESATNNSVISSGNLFTDVSHYVPKNFDHLVFFAGFVLMVTSTFSNLLITNKTISK